MKFSSVSTIILISSILLVAPLQSHLLPRSNLIEHICHGTPHYHLCVLTLKTQQLVITDMAACARVIFKVMVIRTPIVLERIHKALGEAQNQPQLKTTLDSCSRSYTQIINEHLPKAISCMEAKDYDGATQRANSAKDLAASCANKCNSTSNNNGNSNNINKSITSPLGDSNLYVQNMCSITVAIIKQLREAHQQTTLDTTTKTN